MGKQVNIYADDVIPHIHRFLTLAKEVETVIGSVRKWIIDLENEAKKLNAEAMALQPKTKKHTALDKMHIKKAEELKNLADKAIREAKGFKEMKKQLLEEAKSLQKSIKALKKKTTNS